MNEPHKPAALVAISCGILLVAIVSIPPASIPPRRALDRLHLFARPDGVRAWHQVEELPRPLAQFPTVFWEPRDTDSLRQWIRESGAVRGQRVLEIGTGTGLLALCCLQAGAAHVVATDVNPAALANARFNAQQLSVAERLETRQVPLDDAGAFSVIRADERFDLILSNPPWENHRPNRIDDYALFDPGFGLMQSLLAGLSDHLQPGGEARLAYGCTSAIRELLAAAPRQGLTADAIDPRSLDELPEVFLPGMMIRVK